MRISLMLAAAAVGIACVSCGSAKNKNDIKGMWSIEDNDVEGGYIFGDDDLADIYMYPADSYLTDSGMLFGGTYISNKFIAYDNGTLTVNLQENNYITAECIDKPDADSYIGEYRLVSGELTDTIFQIMGITDKENTELLLNIENEKIRITVKDAIEYSFSGDKLELKGRNGIPDSSGDAELSGDKMTVKRADGGERVLTRIEEE